jgi:hypothetical protein
LTPPTPARWPSSTGRCSATSTGRADEPPPAAEPDPKGTDWLALRDPQGGPGLAFQQVDELQRSTWLADGVPQQLHLDTTGPPKADLDAQHERAMSLGATVLLDRSEDPEERSGSMPSPAGHPFLHLRVARLKRS